MQPTRETIFMRGAKGLCPRCAASDIFLTSFRLRERCPRCGLPLELEDGWSYGSVPLSYILACLVWVLPVTLLTLFGVLGAVAGAVIGIAGVVVLPIVTYRFTKRLWVGLYYALLPNELRQRSPGEKGDDH